MDNFSGGSWTMIPTHNSSNPTQPNQDPLSYLSQQQSQQQQFLHHQSPQQFQPHQPQHQQIYQQQRLLQQQQKQQQQMTSPPPPPPPPQQQQQHQSLASHFHLLHLVENLVDVVEHGNKDQQADALINELSNQFEKCQQLLNSISGSISTKAVTVEGQKKKLEESEKMLNQRRDLIANYRNTVEELIKTEL